MENIKSWVQLYQHKLEELHVVREKHGEDSPEEESALDELDVIWYERMSDVDRLQCQIIENGKRNENT